MPAIPVFDLKPLTEVPHDSRINERLAAIVEVRFIAERGKQDLKAFSVGIRAEVV
jgi:hypothetical protein